MGKIGWSFMGNLGKYIFKKVVLVFFIVVYINIQAFIASRLYLDNIVIELILTIVTIVLAIITTELIFRDTKRK